MPHMFQTKIVLLNTQFSEKKCSIWRISFSTVKHALCYNINMGIKGKIWHMVPFGSHIFIWLSKQMGA